MLLMRHICRYVIILKAKLPISQRNNHKVQLLSLFPLSQNHECNLKSQEAKKQKQKNARASPVSPDMSSFLPWCHEVEVSYVVRRNHRYAAAQSSKIKLKKTSKMNRRK